MAELNTASFSLYHPRGFKVHFTVACDLNVVEAKASAAFANGYSVNLPGLEAGEYRESVGAIVRYNKKNSDGTISPRIYFYSDKTNLVHKLIDTYLDSADEIREFEHVSGLSLATVPAWQAKSTPDRKEADEAGVLVAVGKPFQVVFKDNPDYKGEGDKEHTKYEFVRYDAMLSVVERPTPPPSFSASSPASSAGSADALPTTVVENMNDTLNKHFGEQQFTITPGAMWGYAFAIVKNKFKEKEGFYYRLIAKDDENKEIEIAAFSTTALRYLGFDLDAIDAVNERFAGHHISVPYIMKLSGKTRYYELDDATVKARYEYQHKELA